MHIFWIVTVTIFLGYVFSQFGSRLAAGQSALWWILGAFLLLAAAFPDSLRPLANALGIQLVSNFVFMGLILFLIFEVMSLNARGLAGERRLRETVCADATRQFTSRVVTAPRRALVVLPCYNENQSIEKMVTELEQLADNAGPWHIDYCFVDDGSQDGTPRALSRFAPSHFVRHLSNVGVGGVLLTGFDIVRRDGYDALVQCDSDGQHPVSEIPRLLRVCQDGKYDILVGSRFGGDPSGTNPLESTTSARRFGAQLIHACLRLFGDTAGCDDPTSGFRVYSARAIDTIRAMMPDEFPEPEMLAIAKMTKLSIGQTLVTMQARSTGVSSLAGWRSVRYMVKVLSALVGLRLRMTVRQMPHEE